MKNLISLRLKIYLIISCFVFVTLLGAGVMFWYTYKIEGVLNNLIERDVAAFQLAEALESALVNQKGFVAYYVLDKDPDWLRQLGEYRQIFKQRLNDTKKLSEDDSQKKIINDIEQEYNIYIELKDMVINYYNAGEYEKGAKLHKDVRKRFSAILTLCDKYKNLHKNKIIYAKEESHNEAVNLRFFAITGFLIIAFLAVIMAFVFVYNILRPVHSLIIEAGREGKPEVTDGSTGTKDEIKTLAESVRELIDDIDLTHTALEKSREHLQQAEKMALVGKLAAGMAHSIRNPFTSIKMRLFSLGRAQNMAETQKDDIKVISEEIKHIDTIVQNFLEFSRPPKLKMQKISPSGVVDLALQLLVHRLKTYDVTVEVMRNKSLPEINADPEQLKEVFVNLIVNACEAMVRGGFITINEKEAADTHLGSAVIIEISDNGPGIPDFLIGKIMEPFFTTKEEGTGLGLSIVASIIEEHKGSIDIKSKEGEGTTFIITLPLYVNNNKEKQV